MFQKVGDMEFSVLEFCFSMNGLLVTAITLGLVAVAFWLSQKAVAVMKNMKNKKGKKWDPVAFFGWIAIGLFILWGMLALIASAIRETRCHDRRLGLVEIFQGLVPAPHSLKPPIVYEEETASVPAPPPSPAAETVTIVPPSQRLTNRWEEVVIKGAVTYVINLRHGEKSHLFRVPKGMRLHVQSVDDASFWIEPEGGEAPFLVEGGSGELTLDRPAPQAFRIVSHGRTARYEITLKSL